MPGPPIDPNAGFNPFAPPDTGGVVTVANGRSVLMNRVTGAIIRDLGPAPEARGDQSAQVDGAGVPYVISGGQAYTLDGKPYNPVPIPVNPHPGTSFSYGSNVSQSFQDPAALALQRAQLDASIQQADRAHALAIEARDFVAARYWQDRSDTLAARQSDMAFQAKQAEIQRSFTGGENAATRAASAAEAAAGRSFTGGENAAQRAFTGNENATERASRLAESAADRAFRASESGVDRALRASEFASAFGLQQHQERRAVQQDALAAAEQYARQISLTDPAALPAFLAAGGGNVGNAIASGATALSENALLPAARTLRTIENPVRQTPFEFQPQQFDPRQFADAFAPSPRFAQSFFPPPPEIAAAQARGAAMAAAINAGALPNPSAAVPAQESPASTNPNLAADQARGAALAAAINAGTAVNPAEQAAANARMEAAGVPAWVPRFAFGTPGMPASGPLIAGDSTDPENPAAGGARPELVIPHDPPGPDNATADVMPLTPPMPSGGDSDRMAALFKAIGDFLSGEKMQLPPQIAGAPRFAFGTDALATVDDQPYIDRVRALRMSTLEPSIFPDQVGDQTYNVGFFRQPQAIQQRIAAARQSRYGVPSDVTLEQARQYALQGVGRGAFTFGL